MLKVQTGQFNIIDSGVFHVLEDGKTTLQFENVTLELIFKTDEKEKPSIIYTVSDDKTASIKIINGDQSLGFGTAEPFQIGENDGNKLFLHLVTRSLNSKKLRTFEYTLYKSQA